ncbi:MAG: hypothetical protein H0U76_03720 [Ktedonobacteraceae bacterium]|nr:hypothetical protein [Ktedonobacteraceae bacterium]
MEHFSIFFTTIPSANQRLEDLKLAQVGEERLQHNEINAQIEQVRSEYRAQGRDEAWINDRILNLTGRNALTDQSGTPCLKGQGLAREVRLGRKPVLSRLSVRKYAPFRAK